MYKNLARNRRTENLFSRNPLAGEEDLLIILAKAQPDSERDPREHNHFYDSENSTKYRKKNTIKEEGDIEDFEISGDKLNLDPNFRLAAGTNNRWRLVEGHEKLKFLQQKNLKKRYSVLDLILQTVEALSVIDGYSQELCSNKSLFQLLKDLVKLPDKIEFANSCVTAAVLTANILTDAADLALEISNGMTFLGSYRLKKCLLIVNWKTHLKFPEEAELSSEAKDLISKLLCNVNQRLGADHVGIVHENSAIAKPVSLCILR
ncbi:hypothetical protein LguiA_005553 [Lonicera macranthoides]